MLARFHTERGGKGGAVPLSLVLAQADEPVDHGQFPSVRAEPGDRLLSEVGEEAVA